VIVSVAWRNVFYCLFTGEYLCNPWTNWWNEWSVQLSWDLASETLEQKLSCLSLEPWW